MYRTVRIMAATLIGGFLGLRLSAGLELFAPGYNLAFVGGLVGGLIGWIGVAPVQFMANVRHAWKEVVNRRVLADIGKTAKLAVRTAFWMSAAIFAAATSAGVLTLAFGIGGAVLFSACFLIIATALSCFVWVVFLIEAVASFGSQTRHELRGAARGFKWFALNYNPVAGSYRVFVGLRKAVPHTPVGVIVVWGFLLECMKALGQVIKLSIIYSHNNLRTIALVDSAVGWSIGWTLSTTFGWGFSGEIVGAIVGALWAGFNYVVVARGWLKLEPRLETVRQ